MALHKLRIAALLALATALAPPRLRAPVRPPQKRGSIVARAESDASTPEDTTASATCVSAGRLDAFLAGAFPDRSRREWAAFVEGGAVRVNGDLVRRKSAKVAADDVVAVAGVAPAPAPSAVVPEDLPLDVLLEDAAFLVVNKEAGMVTHPAPGVRSGTLANAAAHLCGGSAGVERAGIVHRLDRFTSGAIVVARSAAAQRVLQAQFANRTVGKLYLAVLARAPPAGDGDDDELVIDAPIGRHPVRRDRMCVASDGEGRRAVSRVRVLATDDAGRAVPARNPDRFKIPST